jgi:hypothetical protein
MIKKFIGLVLMFVIFYLAIQSLVFLPQLTNLVIGENKSPFQVGTDYVNQINEIYPYGNETQFGNKGRIAYNSNTANNIVGKVTLEKINGKLIMSVESANPKANLNIWLVNTPEITSKTEYIDFGKLIRSESILEYVIDMKGGDISFEEYNTVFLVDTNAGYQAYAKILLK